MPEDLIANKVDNYVSGIADNISAVNTYYDFTAIQIVTAVTGEVDTGATKTGSIVDLSKYNSVMLWVDSSSYTTVAAGMTGLDISFHVRPSSGSPWGQVAIQSGIGAEATSMLKVRGTGLTASGIIPIQDLKVLFANISGSATATVNAWLMAKGT